MNTQEEESIPLSCEVKEDVADDKLHPLCYGCPYGRVQEFCFPCWKYLLGQGGYH